MGPCWVLPWHGRFRQPHLNAAAAKFERRLSLKTRMEPLGLPGGFSGVRVRGRARFIVSGISRFPDSDGRSPTPHCLTVSRFMPQEGRTRLTGCRQVTTTVLKLVLRGYSVHCLSDSNLSVSPMGDGLSNLGSLINVTLYDYYEINLTGLNLALRLPV